MSKIKVTQASQGWKARPTSDPLFTIHIEGEGEPQRTFDKELAVVGEHEAEKFTAKNGKEYWRTPKKPGGNQELTFRTERQFKADPEKQESIEWQSCLKAATDTVNGYYGLFFNADNPPSLEQFKKDVVNTAITYKRTVDIKPDDLVV